MGTLLDLIGGLQPVPKTNAISQVEVTSTPAANYPQSTTKPPRATTAAPALPAQASATEGTHESRRSAWTITRGGKPICTVCGSPMTYTEALAEVRWRWPDAEVL